MVKFNTHGGFFAPRGYFKVNEGGSHEENPNGGVQVGVDQQGVPNMLEEGEPVYDDYVYSDNITADEEILKKYNIPVKYAGQLYSKIADAYVDEAEQRPNDPISNNGLNAMLLRLADAQEEQKAIAEQKELEDELASMSPEELDQLEAMLADQQAAEEEQAAQAQAMEVQQPATPEEQMMAQQMTQPGMPMQPMMACGGKMRKYAPGGLLIDPPTRTVITPQRDNTATIFTGTGTGLPYEEPLENRQPGLLEIIDDKLNPNEVTLSNGETVPIVGSTGALGWFSPSKWWRTVAGAANGAVQGAKAANKVKKVADVAKAGANTAKPVVEQAVEQTAKKATNRTSSAVKNIAKKEQYGRTAAEEMQINMAREKANEISKLMNDNPLKETAKTFVNPFYQFGKGYRIGRDVRGWNKFNSIGNAAGRGITRLPASYAMYDTLFDISSNENKDYSKDWDNSGAFDLGGKMNKFAYGGPDDPPMYLGMYDSYYNGELPYTGTSLRPMFYRTPQGTGMKDTGLRSGNLVERGVPNRRVDYGRPWYTYQRGDDISWNTDVDGIDRTRILDGTDVALVASPTLGVGNDIYGFGDTAQRNASGTTLKSAKTPLKRVDTLGTLPSVSRINVSVAGRPTSDIADLQREQWLEANGLALNDIDQARNEFGYWNDKDKYWKKVGSANTPTEKSKVNIDQNALPTWMRYAGIANSAADLLWNLAQKPDKYNIPYYNPVLPEGQMNLIDPVFNPLDENMAVNDVLASSAGTGYGLRNSGLGPSTGAALLAADYNAGKNIGTARTQVWDANNQRRNNVIAQRNQNGQLLGAFNWGINNTRAGILNDAILRNYQNALLQQRLNNAAEQEKWNAFRDSKEALAKGLAGVGRENFALNQINLNEALDYLANKGYDVTYKGKKVACGGKISRKNKK